MKTSEAKISSTAARPQKKEGKPFFTKEAGGSFFSKSNDAPQNFFNSSAIQTKLTIGQPNDKYEQEADAMADKVVQRLATPDVLTKKETAVQAKPLAAAITPLIQTKCASCEEEEKLQKKDEKDDDELKKVQRKPVFESNAEPPDDENNIQRKCAECESASAKATADKEEKLQKKSGPSDSPTASPDIESSLNSSKGSGSSLPATTRKQMENSFGADFSGVRLHTDSSAVQMNKGLHAQAFTHGSDIYFNSGKYDGNSTGGKQLLAHELTHVVQQGAASGLVQRSCGIEEIGEPAGCEPMAGDVKGPRYLFKVDCDVFARGNDIDLEKDAMMIQDNANVEIHGFASVEGNPGYNQKLSCARTIAAKTLVESVLSKQRVTANIKIFSHGPQPGNRTVMRGVTVLINNPAPHVDTACPPSKDFKATTLNDYVDLIKCVEKSTSLTNRQVLALLRQMYYGKGWSATSTASQWDKVIPCNINPGDPRALLHPDLFDALHRSVDIPLPGAGTPTKAADIGHVFTGLESMMCPKTKVKIDDTFLVADMLDDISNVEMSNEQFATWGGDLGAAVAAMASCFFMDDDQRKKSKDCQGADLMKGLLGFLEIHAPDTDLEGDIVPFVLRANANGIPCSGSLGQTLSLSAPVSELFVNYLSDKKSGSGHIDRYKCFADIIGANVINGQIQNKDEVVKKFYYPVLEFAKTYYVKIMVDVHGKIPPHRVVPFGNTILLMEKNTRLAIMYFLAWIERKMNGTP